MRQMFAIAFTLITTGASAELRNAYPQVRYVENAPDGYVVNDLLIDFEGRLFGQQLVIELYSGSIYQDALGGENPPNPAFFPVAPSLEADSYVTIGGVGTAASDQLIIGGSTELGTSSPKQFDTAGVDIAWSPAPGIIVEDGVDFPIARVTLSDDATGRFWLYSNVDGTGVTFASPCTFEHGNLEFYPKCFPEPTTGMLTGLVLLSVAMRRKN